MPCYWIKEGFKMEKIDTEEWFSGKLEQVKDHPAYLEEKRRLEMDELREKIAEIIDVSFVGIFYAPTPDDRERMILEYANQILDLIVEEGYLPPEYNIVVLNGVEGAIEVLKKKGWKSPEEWENMVFYIGEPFRKTMKEGR
jgi:hypothetical protein